MCVCIEAEMENTRIIPTEKCGHIKWKILLKDNSEDE